MARPTNAAIVDLKGRKWEPFETSGTTGYVTYTEKAGEIHVPYGTDPVSKTIQAHELAHVRYTSKVWPDAAGALTRLSTIARTTRQIVGYGEDMRITALAGRLNVKTLPEFGNALDEKVINDWVASFVRGGIPESRAKRAARFILTRHTSVLKKLGITLDTLQRPSNAERYVTYCAQYLHKLLTTGESDKADSSKSDDKSKDKSQADKSDSTDDKSKGDDSADSDTPQSSDENAGDKGSDTGTGQHSDDTDSEAEASKSQPAEGDESSGKSDTEADALGLIHITGMDLPDIRQAMVNSVPAPIDTEKLIQQFQHTLDKANWVPIKKIDRMPLVRRAAQARNRGRKLSETGVTLGSAYDAVAPNERRPFVAKRKGGAGGLTVVIDCSGSMYIDEKELEKLLLKHPQGVVVTYSSDIIDGGSRDYAVVRLIASHGRLAATSDFRDYSAGGNGCDGPVLEWLAKQSGEKVWVCDGVITGKGDNRVEYNHAAMAAWLKAHRITRYSSLEDYLDSL